MRVVFVSDHFSTPEEPGPLRAWQFSLHLCEMGDEVVVIAPRSYRPFSGPDGSRHPDHHLPPGLTVVPLEGQRRAGHRAGRLLEYARHLVLSSIETWKAGPCDVLVAGLTPSVLGFGPYLVSRIRRVPFVIDERDLAVDAAACLGLLPAPVLSVARRFEGYLHGHAEHVVTVSEGIRRVLVGRGVAPERVTVVPNGYDQFPAAHVTRAEVRRRHGWDDRAVVIYVGGVGPSHDLGLALDAIQRVPPDELLLVIVGAGPEKNALRRRADRLFLPVEFLPPAPKCDVGALCRAADIGLLPLKPHPYWSCSLPAKLFDYLGAAIPVVAAAPDGDTSALVEAAEAGVVVPAGDADALAAALRMLARSPCRRAQLGAAGRAFVEERYRREQSCSAFRDVLVGAAKAEPNGFVPGRSPVQGRERELERIRAVYRTYDADPAEQIKRDRSNAGLRAMVEQRWTALEAEIRRLGLGGDSAILDVGCGGGELLRRIGDVVCPGGPGRPTLWGIDILPDRINQARALLPDAHFEVQSADRLAFPSRSFDLVVVSTVFSSILDEGLATAVASELLRVLKSEGAIICYDVRYPNPANRNTRAVTGRRLGRLFTGARVDVRSLTLLPPLARRLGAAAPTRYRRLHAVPLLRSHYLAVITHDRPHKGITGRPVARPARRRSPLALGSGEPSGVGLG